MYSTDHEGPESLVIGGILVRIYGKFFGVFVPYNVGQYISALYTSVGVCLYSDRHMTEDDQDSFWVFGKWCIFKMKVWYLCDICDCCVPNKIL